MSRGGRGGGRFGRGGGSVAQDLIRDNLEDLGLDSYQNHEDSGPPPLYPFLDPPLPLIPTQDEICAVNKMRDFTTR